MTEKRIDTSNYGALVVSRNSLRLDDDEIEANHGGGKQTVCGELVRLGFVFLLIFCKFISPSITGAEKGVDN